MNILRNKKRDFLITKKRHFYRSRSIAVNVLQLGDVAKKHTQIIELLPVRKAQNQLLIKPNLAILPNCCYAGLWVAKTKYFYGN